MRRAREQQALSPALLLPAPSLLCCPGSVPSPLPAKPWSPIGSLEPTWGPFGSHPEARDHFSSGSSSSTSLHCTISPSSCHQMTSAFPFLSVGSSWGCFLPYFTLWCSVLHPFSRFPPALHISDCSLYPDLLSQLLADIHHCTSGKNQGLGHALS